MGNKVVGYDLDHPVSDNSSISYNFLIGIADFLLCPFYRHCKSDMRTPPRDYI